MHYNILSFDMIELKSIKLHEALESKSLGRIETISQLPLLPFKIKCLNSCHISLEHC